MEGADESSVVFRDPLWAAEIVPGYDVPGWFILRARLHAERITGLDDEELSSFGRRARDLVAAVTDVTGAPATYLLVFGENYPHFHALIAARGHDVPPDLRAGNLLKLRAERHRPGGGRGTRSPGPLGVRPAHREASLCLTARAPARSGSAQATPAAFRRDIVTAATAITNVRVFDGERLGEPATVLAEDGMISAARRRAAYPTPAPPRPGRRRRRDLAARADRHACACGPGGPARGVGGLGRHHPARHGQQGSGQPRGAAEGPGAADPEERRQSGECAGFGVRQEDGIPGLDDRHGAR